MNTRICVYALLDNSSGRTFAKEDSLRKLGMEGIKSKFLLTTMHGTQEIETKAVDGLMASNFENIDASPPLPRTCVSQQIPASRDKIFRPEMVQEWPHLQQVSKHIPTYIDNVEVGRLIGLNCAGAVRPRDCHLPKRE